MATQWGIHIHGKMILADDEFNGSLAFRSYVKLYNVHKNTPSTNISLAPKNKENI